VVQFSGKGPPSLCRGFERHDPDRGRPLGLAGQARRADHAFQFAYVSGRGGRRVWGGTRTETLQRAACCSRETVSMNICTRPGVPSLQSRAAGAAPKVNLRLTIVDFRQKGAWRAPGLATACERADQAARRGGTPCFQQRARFPGHECSAAVAPGGAAACRQCCGSADAPPARRTAARRASERTSPFVGVVGQEATGRLFDNHLPAETCRAWIAGNQVFPVPASPSLRDHPHARPISAIVAHPALASDRETQRSNGPPEADA